MYVVLGKIRLEYLGHLHLSRVCTSGLDAALRALACGSTGVAFRGFVRLCEALWSADPTIL